jgi:hypothetical protein
MIPKPHEDIPKNMIVQCRKCKHLRLGSFACDAFPKKIPYDILVGKHDHTSPYLGDSGILFEER